MAPSCSTLGLTGLTAPPGFPAFPRASFPFSNANPTSGCVGAISRRSRRLRRRPAVAHADSTLPLYWTRGTALLEKFLSIQGAYHHLDDFFFEGFSTLQELVFCGLSADDLIELHIDEPLRNVMLNFLKHLRVPWTELVLRSAGILVKQELFDVQHSKL